MCVVYIMCVACIDFFCNAVITFHLFEGLACVMEYNRNHPGIFRRWWMCAALERLDVHAKEFVIVSQDFVKHLLTKILFFLTTK